MPSPGDRSSTESQELGHSEDLSPKRMRRWVGGSGLIPEALGLVYTVLFWGEYSSITVKTKLLTIYSPGHCYDLPPR